MDELLMLCPHCGVVGPVRVLFTEVVPDGLRRRLQCQSCSGCFVVLETMRELRVTRRVLSVETVAEGARNE